MSDTRKCRRTACQSESNVVCQHYQTGEWYCVKCARLINQHNPGLVEIPSMKNKLIASGPVVLTGVDHTSRVVMEGEIGADGNTVKKYVVYRQTVNREAQVERGGGNYFPSFQYDTPDKMLAAAHEAFARESGDLVLGYPAAGAQSVERHELYVGLTLAVKEGM